MLWGVSMQSGLSQQQVFLLSHLVHVLLGVTTRESSVICFHKSCHKELELSHLNLVPDAFCSQFALKLLTTGVFCSDKMHITHSEHLSSMLFQQKMRLSSLLLLSMRDHD